MSDTGSQKSNSSQRSNSSQKTTNSQQTQPPKQVKVRFARTPYTTDTSKLLDYDTTVGRKHYERACNPLSTDELFDCTPETLLSFLNEVTRRSQEFGWNDYNHGILLIPKDITATLSPTINLLTNHGELTIKQIQDYDTTYIATDCRQSQDNAMLYECLMNSLTKAAKDELSLHTETIEHISGFPSGTVLLKVIIQISHIDTHATTQAIRLKLSELDKYMVSVQNNVKKFNLYVHYNVRQLNARGEKTDDLLTNLFKGYLAVKDERFLDYMERKQTNYEEGEDITVNQLMDWAKNRYEILHQKGLWEAPSKAEQQILALQTQVSDLKKKNKNNSSNRNGNRNSNKNNNNNNKNNKNRSSNRQRKRDNMPTWQTTEPSEADKWKVKQMHGRDWWWCGKSTGGNCECYRQHKPDTCKPDFIPKHMQDKQGDKDNGSETKKKKKEIKNENEANPKKKLKLGKALQAIIPQDDGGSDSD